MSPNVDLGIQLAATVLLLYTLYEMGNHKLRGPLLAAISETLWVVVGIQNRVIGFMLIRLRHTKSETY